MTKSCRKRVGHSEDQRNIIVYAFISGLSTAPCNLFSIYNDL
jgi:hypothetical protein